MGGPRGYCYPKPQALPQMEALGGDGEMGSDEIVAALKKRRSAEVRLLCLEPADSGLEFRGVSVLWVFGGL